LAALFEIIRKIISSSEWQGVGGGGVFGGDGSFYYCGSAA